MIYRVVMAGTASPRTQIMAHILRKGEYMEESRVGTYGTE